MPRADMSRAWKERPISTFFATGCGIGMIPWAPGTWGSAEGLILAMLIGGMTGFGPGRGLGMLVASVHEPMKAFIAVLSGAAVLAVLGTVWSGRAEERCDGRDPGQVVIDEVVGQLLATAPIFFFRLRPSLWVLFLVSFALFRLFDIWKPGPIRRLQELPGGWGIMLDDVAAGLLAGVLTYGIGRLL